MQENKYIYFFDWHFWIALCKSWYAWGVSGVQKLLWRTL